MVNTLDFARDHVLGTGTSSSPAVMDKGVTHSLRNMLVSYDPLRRKQIDEHTGVIT